MKTIRFKDCVMLAVIAITVGFYFIIISFYKNPYILGDGLDMYYPWRVVLSKYLDNNALPFWSSLMTFGHPLSAQPGVAYFYPLTLFLFKFMVAHTAYAFSLFLHYALAGIFAYIYAKSINLGRQSSLVCALVYALGGFMGGNMPNEGMINTAAWLPLVLFFIEMFFKRKAFVYVIFSGITLGIQFLAGHSQIAYYCAFGAAAYFLLRLIFTISSKERKSVIFYVIALFSMVIVCFGISAIQNVPTYELLRFAGINSNESKIISLTESLPFVYFSSFLLPTLSYDWELEWQIYIGILPFFFVLLSLSSFAKKTNPVKIIHIILLVVALLWAMGRFTPFVQLLKYIPGLSYFRYPYRINVLSSFSLAVLAAFGYESLLAEIFAKNKGKKRFILISGGIFLAIAVIILSAIWKGSLVVERYQHLITQCAVIICSIICFLLLLLNRRKYPIIYAVCLGLIIFDLLLFRFDQHALLRSDKCGDYDSEYLKKPAVVDFLKRDESIYRIYSFGWSDIRNEVPILWTNNNMRYGIQTAVGVTAGALTLRRYVALMSLDSGKGRDNDYTFHDEDVGDRIWEMDPEESFNKFISSDYYFSLFSMMNIKYVITERKIEHKYLQLVYERGSARVYQNTKVLPRAYVVSQVKAVKSEEEAFSALVDSSFDVKKSIVLEGGGYTQPDKAVESAVRIEEYGDRKVRASVYTAGNSFLFLSDTFYPGWEAFVDGKKEKIYRANFLFRAVPLGPGKHIVEFVYKPLSFYYGAAVTFATIAGLFLLFIFILLRKRQ